MCDAYLAYFGVPVGDQDKNWAPHYACEHCNRTLLGKSHCNHYFIPLYFI
jgi:hypothetical protein